MKAFNEDCRGDLGAGGQMLLEYSSIRFCVSSFSGAYLCEELYVRFDKYKRGKEAYPFGAQRLGASMITLRTCLRTLGGLAVAVVIVMEGVIIVLIVISGFRWCGGGMFLCGGRLARRCCVSLLLGQCRRDEGFRSEPAGRVRCFTRLYWLLRAAILLNML